MLNLGMLKEGEYKILTGANVKWESDKHYVAMLEFAMACCEFMDNVGDMEFINTLPMTMEEFHQQASTIKDRYILIIKSHIAHFDTYPDKEFEVPDRVTKAQQKIDSLHRIGSELPEEIEQLKSSMMHELPPEPISIENLKVGGSNLKLADIPAQPPVDDKSILEYIENLNQQISLAKEGLTKQEFRTLEECALEMEKRTDDGKFKTYRASFKWAVDNCTITSGKPLVRWNQLEKALERAKDSGRDIEIPERIKRNL
jgi:hypothetical protein